ncbi:fungal-specific transcription factor domain-containing protein [Penicillium odoratum]|uniref:fungal-specific transcription factor domain-containing protein n=1 Tax=Penicillium odoratum TaxID=1167516 RepID=UPI002548E20E|nr:fungal-specific transcription factor domain-containing protein [Penicillium odoratum]KAJ5753210.1 fungal-specific transcription factor domain-containing protein [Penicillium odoratum]
MEVDFLVLWVHYHDILGKFTSRHWKVQSAENASLFKVPGMASTLVSSVANESVGIEIFCGVKFELTNAQVLGIFGCSLEMINIIARMANITPYTIKPDSVQYAEQNILSSIEHDLMTIKQATTYLQGTSTPEEVDHASKVSQLYRLSALIYFERVLTNSSTGRLTRWVSEAFELIPQLSLCERPFPLFFVACEANTEMQRGLILSLLRRTEQQLSQWRLHDLQGMIESMWVQHDLSADLEEMNYVESLNAVLSSSKLLPTLA